MSLLGAAVRRFTGDEAEDEWGLDPGYAKAVQPVFDGLYDVWWRVTAIGTEHVPETGPVLIVANHAGLIPWDAAMVTTALRRAWGPQSRRPRFLMGDETFTVPWLGVGARRLGGVPARQSNALRLLEDGHAVLAFPEGARAAAKPYKERYHLQRFGRGGFAETALRAGVRIVPCGIVGAEEAYPRLGEIPALARLARLPAFPITPTFPLLGPLGLVPLPTRWRIAFGEPIAPEGEAEDRVRVLELAEQVKDQVQALVHEHLIQRAGAFS